MDSSSHARDHLANERTFLAWLRTSFSLLTLGFATNKFSQFLIEARLKAGEQPPHEYLFGSRRLGLGMVILGTILVLVATWSYQSNRRRIDQGQYIANTVMIWLAGAVSIFLGASAIVLILQA
jgi:putative membrane protein